MAFYAARVDGVHGAALQEGANGHVLGCNYVLIRHKCVLFERFRGGDLLPNVRKAVKHVLPRVQLLGHTDRQE